MRSSVEILATAPTELDRQVELIRMCVAEAGYDPALIEPYDGPLSGFFFVAIDDVIPSEVCWRARELVGLGDPKCLRCTLRDRWQGVIVHCRATARLQLDCGAEEAGNDERSSCSQD
jgi:hypothetical protein